MAPRRKNTQIHHVDFAKVNRRWVAYIYIDPNTTISQQTVGSKKNVDKIIKTQLEPQGIPYTIEGMTEMTNYPTYMVKAGLVPNPKHPRRGKTPNPPHSMEGILRSGWFPTDKYAGTTLFILYEDGSYVVRSRFQDYYRSRKVTPNTEKGRTALKRAEQKFEELVMSNAKQQKNPSRKANAGASPLKFSFQWSKGGGSVKFRKGPVGKVGRIEVSVRPTNTFHAYLYEDAPNWVLMKDYINVGRSDGYTHQKDVPYATKVTVWKAAQKALEKETGLSPTPRAQPRRRKNSDKGEKYAQLFRDLRDKRITTIQLDMKGVMGGGTGGFRTFKRGRMGKPKRWRGGWDKPAFERVSLSVVPLDDMGNPIKMRAGYKLWLSEYDDGTADVSASIGDMGLMLQGMKKNPRKRKNPDALMCEYQWYTIRRGRGAKSWYLSPKYSIPGTRFASSQVEYDFPSQAEAKRQGKLYEKEIDRLPRRPNPDHKGEVNPYSKRYTYMDFTKKFWGKDWRTVPRDIRLSFWDDFKLAFVGGLQKYKEETEG